MWRVQRVVLFQTSQWQQLNKWSRLVAGTRMQIKGTVSKDQLKQRTGQRVYLPWTGLWERMELVLYKKSRPFDTCCLLFVVTKCPGYSFFFQIPKGRSSLIAYRL